MIKQHLLLLTLLTLVLSPAFALAAEVQLVTPEDAASRVENGNAVLVDIREPSEWVASGVVATAHLLPMSDLNGERKLWDAFLKKHAESELIFYCRSGGRAGRAADMLAEEGYQTASAGGLRDWVAADQSLRKADEPRQETATTSDD